MPAYNFQRQFADAVMAGTKLQTVRASLRGAARGKTAYLYTGQRTKACKKLGEGTITAVNRIEIGVLGNGEPYASIGDGRNADWLVHGSLEKFARADGFENVEAMMAFFRKSGLPFKGWLHEWRLNKCA